jgi:hypothetical protein
MNPTEGHEDDLDALCDLHERAAALFGQDRLWLALCLRQRGELEARPSLDVDGHRELAAVDQAISGERNRMRRNAASMRLCEDSIAGKSGRSSSDALRRLLQRRRRDA